MRNIALALVLLIFSAVSFAKGTCPPEGYSREALHEVKANGFQVENEPQRNALALGLLACVSDPDPEVRDGIAFEGLSTWLRGNRLAAETLDEIYMDLVSQIRNETDPGGFQGPFAILILSEVARTDRIEPWFTVERRAELVGVAAGYLRGVTDYRGFSTSEGWRHGVAHASDLTLQLVLNPAVDESQIRILMDAVATQIAPQPQQGTEVFYIYGEPGRLARAVVYAYQRGVLDAGWWAGWFEAASAPGSLENWGASFASQAGLARRHNTTAFLLAMHFNATSIGGEQGAALDALVVKAINRVMGG